MPVTLNCSDLSSSSVCPMGSLSPKYFFAVVSVSTTLAGSFNTVEGSPFNSLNENRLKKSRSVAKIRFSLNELTPCEINPLKGITLTAELPGLAVEDIDLRVENDTLTLKGERKLEREDKREGYRRVERSYGSFSRTFSLPDTVDTERIKAESKNGVLKVFLPRREETKPRQIQVKIEG